jgi:hypothetical protein
MYVLGGQDCEILRRLALGGQIPRLYLPIALDEREYGYRYEQYQQHRAYQENIVSFFHFGSLLPKKYFSARCRISLASFMALAIHA